jgi:hypothetical protein
MTGFKGQIMEHHGGGEPKGLRTPHSHSIVPGGFEVMS